MQEQKSKKNYPRIRKRRVKEDKCQTRRIEEEKSKKQNPTGRRELKKNGGIKKTWLDEKKKVKLSRPRQCPILRSAYENIEDLRKLVVAQYTDTYGKHQI